MQRLNIEYWILNTWSVGDRSFHLQASRSPPAVGGYVSECSKKLQKVGQITSTCCKKIFHKVSKVVKCWKCHLNLALVCHQLVAGRWRGGEGHLTLDCSQSLFYFDKSAHPCLTFHRFLFLLFHEWICSEDLLHEIDMVPGKSTMTCQSQRTCATFTSFARHNQYWPLVCNGLISCFRQRRSIGGRLCGLRRIKKSMGEESESEI